MTADRRPLRVGFADLWADFDLHADGFVGLLRQRFELFVTDLPEVLFYSCYGQEHRTYQCQRILVNWENRGWGFGSCDFAITSDIVDHPRHHRFPLFALALHGLAPSGSHPMRERRERKSGFASVVVSNPHGATRNRFVERLSAYRPVASGGGYRNNVGGPVQDAVDFMARYKFNVAFENSSYPGYTTEKLVAALAADTVPIYWGNPLVGRDFNTGRFLNFHDFESEEALMRRVIELDNDDDAYCEVLTRPWFPGGTVPDCARTDLLLDFIEKAVDSGRRPVAQRRSPVVRAQRTIDRFRMSRRWRNRQL